MSAFLQTPRKLVLGGGSNILLSENSYQGLVISNQITGREIIHEDHQSVTIRCGAGENRDEFVWWSIDQ
jgi:UDP-N-acetylmuramate dehydrogenase